MSGKFKSTWFYSSLGTYIKDVGIIGKKEKEFYSQRRVNLDDFANSLQEKYEDLDSEGYDVVNVVPITMGQSELGTQKVGGYFGGIGFSITRGAVVIGKKESHNLCQK